MDTSKILKDKVVLVVDDEVDVTDTVEEVLDMCLIRKANDYDSARQLLMSYTFDVVILDIMGVDGFELLKDFSAKNSGVLSVSRILVSKFLFLNAVTSHSTFFVISSGFNASLGIAMKSLNSSIASVLFVILSFDNCSNRF